MSAYKQALNNGGTYECCGNLAWLAWNYNTAPTVPILRASVEDLAQKNYLQRRGNLFPLTLTVGMTSLKENPLIMIGSLKCVSPAEMLHAPYIALSTLAERGLTESDVEEWTHLFLTTKLKFMLLPSDEDKEFRTMQERMDHAILYQCVTYAPVQWVYKIIQMKASRESSHGKQTPAQIAQMFVDRKFVVARGEETISETFVVNALYVWQHALSFASVQKVLIAGVERYGRGSPFDSLSKIATIIRKCRADETSVKWTLSMMLHNVQEGFVSVGELSNAGILGYKDKKAYFEFLMHKMDIKDHLLGTFLAGSCLRQNVLKVIRDGLSSVETYTQHVPSRTPEEEAGQVSKAEPCLQWMGRWSITEKSAWTFCEDMVYKDTYDSLIKKNLQNRQAALEVLEVSEIRQITDAITEKPAQPTETATTDTVTKPGTPAAAEVTDPRLRSAVEYIPDTITEENHRAVIQKYQAFARRLVAQSVKLLVEPADEAAVMSLLRESHSASKDDAVVTEGDSRSYNIGTYDVKSSGESVTHPHLRLMSFRALHHEKLVRGFLRSCLPEESAVLSTNNFPASAMVLTYDAGKHHGATLRVLGLCLLWL